MTTNEMVINELPCPMARAGRDGVLAYGTPLNRWSVLSTSGHTYVVTQTSNDETDGDGILRTWACSCPAGTHGRRCKHVNAVIAKIDADNAEDEQ